MPAPVLTSLRTSSRLVLATVVAALIGLLLAAAALPIVTATGVAAKERADDYLTLPSELVTPPLSQRSRILAADGSLIAWLYNENRVRVALEEVPQHTRDAVIAIEDSRFYDHDGVDVKGTLRAAVTNSLQGGVQQGGSTLTQQYVKNALLVAATSEEQRLAAREVSVERKLREARYALELERRLGKDEILLRYLNIAYYGNGAYGIGTAAQLYFGKPVSQLTVAESALLAGLVQSPSRLEPVDNPEAALARRNTVLARMAGVGVLTERERAEASATPLGLALSPVGSGCEAAEVEAAFFCDYVRRALEDSPLGASLGETRQQRQQRLLSGGLTIRTTLNPGMQALAQRVIAQRILSDDPSGVAATYTAVVPGTGEVRALVVNRRFGDRDTPSYSKLNLALGGSSGMQAGSTFKPFVLAAALQQGLPLDTTFDSPSTYTSDVFKNCDGRTCDEFYSVDNAGDSNSGRHDIVSGTHGSVNTFYLQLLEKTGIEAPAKIAESMGLRQFQGGEPTAPLHRGGSFVLGVNEVSPLQMTAAYATFAARGLYCPPRPVVGITDADGEEVPLPEQQCARVLAPELADKVNSVLRGTVDGPSSFRTARRADIGRPVAGKTGSTNGSKAAWFVGFVPQLAAAVWVGKPIPEPLVDITIGSDYFRQVYGGTLPAPIWGDIMEPVLRNVRVAPLPPYAVSNPTPPTRAERAAARAAERAAEQDDDPDDREGSRGAHSSG